MLYVFVDQCRQKYERLMNPSTRKGKWTEDEDNLLRDTVKKFGARHWKLVASYVPYRTSK